jgi:uncharacterized membrane protein
MPIEPDSRVLNAVRTPLVLIALFTVALFGISETFLLSGVSWQVKMVIFGVDVAFLSGLMIWMARIVERNPRALSYGPHEYLEESRLAHERNLRISDRERS